MAYLNSFGNTYMIDMIDSYVYVVYSFELFIYASDINYFAIW